MSVLTQARAPRSVTNPKGVLFGPPKTGKTVGAVSGEGKKLLLLLEPDGDAPLVGRTDVDVFQPTTVAELGSAIKELHRPGNAGYTRVVLDSVTFAFEMVGGKEIWNALKDNREARRAFGMAGAAINQFIHDAVLLPIEVVFITQLKLDAPGDDGVPLNPEAGEHPMTMALSPMVYKILTPAVSYIGRTFKRQVVDQQGRKIGVYGVSFEDYGKSPAGARIPIPAEVLDLNLSTLFPKGGE